MFHFHIQIVLFIEIRQDSLNGAKENYQVLKEKCKAC